MIAPLVLYMSLLTEHRQVLLDTLNADMANITKGMKETVEDQTIISIIQEDTTESTSEYSPITIKENYEKISTIESATELIKLSSISGGIHESFIKSAKWTEIPSNMMDYYQTNFSYYIKSRGRMKRIEQRFNIRFQNVFNVNLNVRSF